MIAIIDYGAGNIFSVKNALDYLGFENMRYFFILTRQTKPSFFMSRWTVLGFREN